MTGEGIKNTRDYPALRTNILIALHNKKKGLNLIQFTVTLSEHIAIYEEDDRPVLAYYKK